MAYLKASGNSIFHLCIAMIVLSSISVILRLLAKRKTETRLVVEDWLVMVALGLFAAYVGVIVQSELLKLQPLKSLGAN